MTGTPLGSFSWLDWLDFTPLKPAKKLSGSFVLLESDRGNKSQLVNHDGLQGSKQTWGDACVYPCWCPSVCVKFYLHVVGLKGNESRLCVFVLGDSSNWKLRITSYCLGYVSGCFEGCLNCHLIGVFWVCMSPFTLPLVDATF